MISAVKNASGRVILRFALRYDDQISVFKHPRIIANLKERKPTYRQEYAPTIAHWQSSGRSGEGPSNALTDCIRVPNALGSACMP